MEQLGSNTINETIDLSKNLLTQQSINLRSDIKSSNLDSDLNNRMNLTNIPTYTSLPLEAPGPIDPGEIVEGQPGINALRRHDNGVSMKKVLCCKFSWDSKYLAYSTDEGTLDVLNTQSSKNVVSFYDRRETPSPINCFRWRPIVDEGKTKNVILLGNMEGEVIHWHPTSNQVLHKTVEPKNQIYSVDYSCDGLKFATGGFDCQVRVYDDLSKKKVVEMLEGDLIKHSNRIFSVKFSDIDPNIFVSAGWDSNVLVWDDRTTKPVMLISGPLVFGDSLDVKDTQILTGSWRETDQMQIFDMRTGKCSKKWQFDAASEKEKIYVYAAMFSKDKDAKYVIAGTTGQNAVKVFDNSTLNCDVKLAIRNLRGGVFSLDVSRADGMLAIAGNGGLLKVFDLIL